MYISNLPVFLCQNVDPQIKNALGHRITSIDMRISLVLANDTPIGTMDMNGTRWCPPSYKLVYNPINYRYITYKP
jgi:hypothetical protein